MNNKKVLIIAGGGTKHLAPFIKEAKKLGVNLTTASFSDLEYLTDKTSFTLKVKNEDVASFSLIYIRLVGKRFEDVALLTSYAKEKGIRIVDRIYEKSQYIRLPLAKSLETKLLYKAGIPVPKTFFGNLSMIKEMGPKLFGLPFVIKGTVGKQGHAVWSPRNPDELEKLLQDLKDSERKGGRFIAQEFIEASQRDRVLVVGGKAIAAITRPTRWRKSFIKKVSGKYPEGERKGLFPVPKKDAELAVSAARALSIDIGGIDIIYEDATGKPYVLEVNSAPRWESIRKDCNISPEREIVRFLAELV